MVNETPTQSIKWPRLYVEDELKASAEIHLDEKQTHYLHHVLRKKEGDDVRLFNGKQGEWHGVIQHISKKDITISISESLKEQPNTEEKTHLFFPPIKAARLDWLIEKAVELGVTDLHPIITQNTDIPKIKADRIERQIIEACEQCERLTVPKLHPLEKLQNVVESWNEGAPILACLERMDAPHIKDVVEKHAFLIGPEGGFTVEEKNYLSGHKNIKPVSLGENILRAETAALYVLASK